MLFNEIRDVGDGVESLSAIVEAVSTAERSLSCILVVILIPAASLKLDPPSLPEGDPHSGFEKDTTN